MPVITKQELEDAATDAFSLERIVNGSETENGTGLVTTRLGQQVKTAKKVIAELAAIDVGASAAAAINDKLNEYQIAFNGDVVVDVQAGVVRYPAMLAMRNGQAFKTVTPADYGVTAFEVPFRIATSGICDTHYLDVAAIGTATNPVKTITSAGVPDVRDPNNVILGTTFQSNYQCFWGGDVLYTNRPALILSMATRKPILLDRQNRLGGGPAIYVPLELYINLPEEGVLSTAIPTNPVSTEVPGHAKFVLASASPSVVNSLYYDRTLNQYVLAVYSAQPEGDTRPYVPLIEVWGDQARSPAGIEIQSQDNLRLNNTRWPTVMMFEKRPVFDLSNYLGGGVAVYLPRWLFIQRGDAVINRPAVGTEATELGGYVKLLRPGISGSVSALFYNETTQLYEWNVYSSTSIDLKKNQLDNIYLIAEFWDDGSIKTPYNYRDPRVNIQANQTKYGIQADQMPRRYANTTIVDITEPELLALGFTRGAADLQSTNRPYFGDNFVSYVANTRAFIRFYLETDTANSYGTPRVYLWNATTPTDIKVVMEKKLSNNAASFVARFDTPAIDGALFFYVGSDTQNTSPAVRVKVTGVQYHISNAIAEDIRLSDYPSPGNAVITDYESRDAVNIARSNSLKQRLVTFVQKPTAKYNTKVVYGQSLGRGQETSPSLSRTNRFGNLSLGSNVLPNSNDGSTYGPFTDATLRPLVAQAVDGSTVYNYGSEPAGAFGEPVNHGWVNMGKYLHNQEVLAENDTNRLFVTFNPSVSGKTIEQLSKVNTQDATNRYARFTDGLTKIETATGSDPHVVDGIMWMQGEFNYYNSGGSWDKNTYKTLFGTLIDNMRTDAMAITGQTATPAFFTYQTGAAYTRDVDSAGTPGLHVGMAQLEVSLEKKGVWMVGPVYPYTDKGGHLDANGSRWFGNQIAKVYHQVVRLGKDWQPLRPTRITQSGREIVIDFHVPEPPLVFDSPYVVKTPTMYAAKGFRVTDASGAVTVNNVEIVGNTMIKITLGRDTVGTAQVWYASQTTHNGNGNLRDSDPAVAFDNYVYKPEDGMETTANIPALVNKPYPLQNWCVAFYLPVGYDEV